MKFGRNDPCWCGSGLKFKSCHLGRETEEPPTREQSLNAFQKLQAEQRYCLHPEAGVDHCRGRIVRAHSVQRSALRTIAVGGKVLSFNSGRMGTLIRSHGRLRATQVGVNQASTFTGFCEGHDNSTFAAVEKSAFVASNANCFLLAYRAMCRYWHAIRMEREWVPHLRRMDAGLSPDLQRLFQYDKAAYDEGVELSYSDIVEAKDRYDQALMNSDFSAVGYYAVEFATPVEVVCCGATQIEYDFAGKKLQDMRAKNLDHVVLTILPVGRGGVAVFSWLGDYPATREFVRSLDILRGEEVPNAIVRFAFEEIENVYFGADWWHSLEPSMQRAVENRVNNAANVHVPRRATCLLPEGEGYVSWQLGSRHSNVT